MQKKPVFGRLADFLGGNGRVSVFNRRELLSTFDRQTQARVRQTLSQNRVAYSLRTLNRELPPGCRARTGTLGERLDLECEYRFYVRRQDFRQASDLLRKIR